MFFLIFMHSLISLVSQSQHQTSYTPYSCSESTGAGQRVGLCHFSSSALFQDGFLLGGTSNRLFNINLEVFGSDHTHGCQQQDRHQPRGAVVSFLFLSLQFLVQFGFPIVGGRLCLFVVVLVHGTGFLLVVQLFSLSTQTV